MTIEEAFQEIGVAPGSSPEEIRRAYLRLVKVRKPESDPEGFRRLREAFELLRDQPKPSPEILFRPQPVAEQPAGPTDDGPAFEPHAFVSELEKLEASSSPEELRDAVDAALHVLQMAEERRVFPHPLPILLLLLRLHAQGLVAEAVQVQERFQSFLHASGQELALLGDWTAALWQVAREMSRLSPEFPAPARAAIGGAVATGSPHDALPQLDRMVEEDGDLGWRMAAELKELPGLGGLYHGAILDALAKRSPPVHQEKPSPWHAGGLGGVFIGVWLLIVLSRSCSPSVPSVPSMPYLGASAPVVSLGEALLTACPPGIVPTLGQSVFCRAARDAVTHLRQRRCYDVRATRDQLLEGLQMMRGSAFAHPAEALIAAIRAEYVLVCRDGAF